MQQPDRARQGNFFGPQVEHLATYTPQHSNLPDRRRVGASK